MKDETAFDTPHQPTSAVRPERLVLKVGSAVAFIIMGDSFLYGNLPLEAENLGIALPLVGILLSANRLVRLISNTWASSLFEKFGPRKPFLAAVLLGFCTTALYGAGWGFMVFLLARLGWGIAWSALRQGGYQAVWTGGADSKGKLMGFLWGLIRLGSAFSVLLGGYLRDLWGYRAGISGVLGISLLAIPVAFSIRWPTESRRILSSKQAVWRGWGEALKAQSGRRLLLAGSIHSGFEGILISTASLFLAHRFGTLHVFSGAGIKIGTMAGMLLALRWVSDILFAPVIGSFSDRLGQRTTLISLIALFLISLAGVVTLAGLFLVVSLAFLFVSSAGMNVILSALANRASMKMERPHIYLGVFATALDSGAAIGPLLAYSAGPWFGFAVLYVAGGILLGWAILRYWKTAQH